MKVVMSMDSKNKKYHKNGCYYANRIKYRNSMSMTSGQAIKYGYCQCKYCGGLKGYFRVMDHQIRAWEKENDMTIAYDDERDRVFIRTKIGFWKIVVSSKSGKYMLLHRNIYREDLNDLEARRGDFHRQRDVSETDSLSKIVSYIAAHDSAKIIIAADYRNLPRTTKKQKKYYAIAEKKSKQRSIRNVDSIFSLLESQNPGMKALAAW